jgi:hypothetical protein
MTLTLANAVRSLGANAMLDSVDAGTGPGKIRVYSGSRPAGPDTAVGAQVLLAEFTLADPAWAAAVNGTKDLDADPDLSTTGLAAGTAAWCRFLDSDNVAKYDGSVGTSGADLNLNTTTISVGLTVTITSGTGTMPAG